MIQPGSAPNDEFIMNLPNFPQSTEETVSCELSLAPADYQSLLEACAQSQTVEQAQAKRIAQLEQALDQALEWLDELRSQLKEQQVLEAQLATTEEFSHVQQQAILRLKLQIAEQQQALDAQILETQQRDQAIQELLATIETMTQAQQQELERLRSYITQDQVEGHNHRNLLEQQVHELNQALESRQHRVSELESETLAARTLTTTLREQLTTAQQQIRDLSVRLQQHQADWAQLEAQLAEAEQERNHSVASFPARGLPPSGAALSRNLSFAGSGAASIPATDLVQARRRIEVLEHQLTHQAKHQAQWQQTHQQWDEERDYLRKRVTTLEEQVAEMQEQILHQAQQATEYETAVQYWKDRYTNSQNQMEHLHDLLQQTVAHQGTADPQNPALIELATALLDRLSLEPQDPLPSPTLPLPKHAPELPDFLVHRRRAKERGVSI